MSSTLFSQLQNKALVLTPNQRLAATLLKQYNQEKMIQGKRCWQTPPIRPLVSWIQDLWHIYTTETMNSDYLLLTPNQELILWEEIIAAAPESKTLLKLSDLAQQAKSAWSILKLWETDFHHPAFFYTENSRFFHQWASQFQQRCQERQWIDSASLSGYLIKQINQNTIPLPAHIILLNFTELAPQYKTLLNACQAQGSHIEFISNLNCKASHYHITLLDEDQEIQVMAQWAKKILEQNPQARIGCITAQLEEKRDCIIATFIDTLGDSTQFNISAGKTLTAYPIIQQALQLLRLSTQTIAFANFSAILHSPFIGDAEKEMIPRIQWDELLRRRNITTTTWETLLEDRPHSCKKLRTRLKNYLTAREQAPHTRCISEWLQHFADLLALLGWPGEKSLNSAEYQVVKSWLNLLQEMSSFDFLLDLLTYHQALHYLIILAQKSYFQPESPEAPIQILGQLEGAGLPFDYLWLFGVDDTTWPPPPSPNPLIPQELQRNLAMPNATADRQLNYSLRLMEQFKKAAQEVIFSFALHANKQELRQSPLTTTLTPISLESLPLADISPTYKILYAAKRLEFIQDENAPPILTTAKLQGGASIFEMQAACPFKAFAKLRLGARALEDTEVGLPAKNRGNVLHRVLELFWKEIKDYYTLMQLPADSLQQKISELITIALTELAPFIRTDSLYNDLIKQRFEAILLSWLNYEKQRSPFKVIAVEQEKLIEIDNFSIALRVDRIDELAQGEKLVIDYKTKKFCNIQNWFGERPTEPQLPLYCITSEEYISGLAFAEINASNTELKGITQANIALTGFTPISEKTAADATSWEAQLEKWRIHLMQLFRHFQNGQAAVNPKQTETCRFCDLQTFCRIAENRAFYDE